MKKFLFVILFLAFIQSALLQAYQPKLLWSKYIGSQPGAAIISNDDKFIYCTEGSNLYKLDIDSGTILKKYNIGAGILRISNDDKILYMGTNQGIIVFNLEEEKIIMRLDSTAGTTSLDISADNTKLCYWTTYGNNNDSMRIYSLPDYRLLQSFRYSDFNNPSYYMFYSINNANFTPDGKNIIWWGRFSPNLDQLNIDIYNIEQNKIVSSINNAHSGSIYDLAISTDGKLLASCGYDSYLKVWDIKTKQTISNQLLPLGHTIIKIKFVSNDKFLLTGGNISETAKIWDYNRNKILLEFEDPSHAYHGITTTKNSYKILTYSSSARLFSINFDSLVSVNEPYLQNSDVIYPNPTTNTVQLTFSLSAPSICQIKINNVQGILIKTLFNDHLETGTITKIFDISELSNGVYFINISSINFNKTYKLIKEK